MPTRGPGEPTEDFISRCMGDGKMKEEFSDEKQRYAVCRSYAEGSKEANLEKTDDTVTSSMSCSCSGEPVEAAMTPSDDETHEAFMNRCMDAGNNEEQCMAFHEGHVFPEAATCPPGEKMVDGYCTAVSVTMDLDVDNITSIVEAATGKTIMKISGIAFHEGVNKNGWALTREGAMATIEKIKGKDLTLKHPSIEGGRFGRNMDGGVEEAAIGVVTDASFHDEEGGWVVRYEAEVHRTELFEALESGLWLRPEYGVSIGGTGVPTKVVSYEDGTHEMWFGEEFELDHLAIVHHPAYPKANIEKVEVVEVETAETFIRDSDDTTVQSEKVNYMSDEIENDEMIAEIEALKADMVLRDARINEFESIEATRVENERDSLVEKATTLGLAGHEDFSIETLGKVIASWESSRPEPTPEPEVEMLPATPAANQAVEAVASEPEAVVANFLNGDLIQTDESLYSRAYNAWVAAYNQTVDRESVQAQKYEEVKEKL